MVFIQSTRYSYPILLKLEFSWQIFEKILKYQISWKSWSWTTVIPCGRTDRHDEENSLSSPLYERA